jgi:hypothetical protein
MIAESFPAGMIPIRDTVSEIFGIWQGRAQYSTADQQD